MAISPEARALMEIPMDLDTESLVAGAIAEQIAKSRSRQKTHESSQPPEHTSGPMIDESFQEAYNNI